MLPQEHSDVEPTLIDADVIGTLYRYSDFASAHLPARHVDVLLPPGYADDTSRRYPVLYMHDGQNCLSARESYTGIDWGVDEALARLVARGAARQAIIVAVWNTVNRFAEYMPLKPGLLATPKAEAAQVELKKHNITLRSDDYLRFLTGELKPFIDKRYRTLPGRDDTVLMGSSMGGLITLYAVCEYPEVFGAAGCVSTHWVIGDGLVVDWLPGHLPDPATHRLYFDYGTVGVDTPYAPLQAQADAHLAAAGYAQGVNWLTERFEGADHNEAAWRARVHLPLAFLLRPQG
jgi:predicted alpha/beta superfamily hydrolase